MNFRSCPAGVYREAVETYGVHCVCAGEGNAMLDRIAAIDYETGKLEGVKEVHVGSFNDSNYKNSAISSDELKQLLLSRLSRERRELIEKFNRYFSKGTE